MKVLVTGGSGYLGTHVREFFAADDFSRRSGHDICNKADAAIAVEYDVVIHMAAKMDKAFSNADEVIAVNVDGTKNILSAMRQDATFIYMSTKDIYGRFADSYSEVPENCSTIYAGQSVLEWTKMIGEKFVDLYANERGFRSCIFRLSTVFAPLTEGNTPNIVGNLVKAINFGETIRLPGGGDPVRDLMHVDDLSRACSAFISSGLGHGMYNLGGGKKNAISLNGLVRKLEEASGLQAVISAEDPLPPPVPLNYVSDLSLIMHELDWTPEISLENGLSSLF